MQKVAGSNPAESTFRRASSQMAGRKTTRSQNFPRVALLAVILILAITFMALNFYGPSMQGDDWEYSALAFCTANQCGSHLVTTSFFNIRYLEVLPIALSYELFGVTPLASSLWAALAYLLTIVVVFYISIELFDDVRTAGLVALLFAFFPLVLKYATTVDDDVALMLFLALSTYFLVRGEKRNSNNQFLLSGFFAFIAFLATPSALGFIVVMLVYWIALVLMKKRSSRSFCIFLVGILVAVGVMMLMDTIMFHNPLTTAQESIAWYESPVSDINTNTFYYYPIIFANPLVINSAGLYFFALVPAAAYLVVKKERKSYFFILWAVLGFLLMEYGINKITLGAPSYLPVFAQERYLLFIAVPVAATLGIAIAKLYGSLKKNRAARLALAMLAAAVLADGVVMGIGLHQQSLFAVYDQAQIANYLNNASSAVPVYYLGGDYADALIYMHFNNPGRFYSYASLNCSSIQANSYVLVPDDPGYYGLNYLINTQEYCPSWTLVLQPNAVAAFPKWASDYYFYNQNNGSAYTGERLYYVT